MGGKYSSIAATQWYIEGSRTYGKKGYVNAMKHWKQDALSVDLLGKHYIVTGANAGIGKSVCQTLAEKNASVHMLCRNKSKGETALKEIMEITGNTSLFLHICDVSLEQDVRSFAIKFKNAGYPLSGLVNNAGVMMNERTETIEKHEVTFATMAIGTHLLTSLLYDVLHDNNSAEIKGKVVNVSSAGMYPWRLNPDNLIGEKNSKYDGMMAYSASKRAQVVLTEIWAEKMESKGLNVLINSMHPGWTMTPGIQRSMKDFAESKASDLRSTEQGADTIVWMLVSPEIEELNGKFFFDRAVVRTHMPLAWTKESLEDRIKLWNICSDMYNVKIDN
jgi:dehydrogenase/reductase SDR family protein 12